MFLAPQCPSWWPLCSQPPRSSRLVDHRSDASINWRWWCRVWWNYSVAISGTIMKLLWSKFFLHQNGSSRFHQFFRSSCDKPQLHLKELFLMFKVKYRKVEMNFSGPPCPVSSNSSVPNLRSFFIIELSISVPMFGIPCSYDNKLLKI